METALVRVTNDLLMSADAGSPSILILLDLTAAIDTVDHHILLHRLQYSIGLSDTTLAWFTSYLTDRTEYVLLRVCVLDGIVINVANLVCTYGRGCYVCVFFLCCSVCCSRYQPPRRTDQTHLQPLSNHVDWY